MTINGVTTYAIRIAQRNADAQNNSSTYNTTFAVRAGVIVGTGQLEKTGAGRLILLGSNTYTGSISVAGGTLQVGNGAASAVLAGGSGTLAIGAGATTEFFSPSISTNFILGRVIEGAGTLTFRGTGVNGQSIYSIISNNSNLTGAVRLGIAGDTQGSRVIVGNANTLGGAAVTVLNGSTLQVITGGRLSKNGTGTLTLSGANTYTGTTTVSGGTLRINGNQSAATGAVTVNTGATLGGSGTVGGAVTVATGGTLAPGTSPEILTVVNNVSFASGSTFAVELNGTTVGTQYDRLVVNGTVTINSNANLNATLGYVPGVNDRLFILTNDGTDPVSSFFSGRPNGTQFQIGGYFATINYTGDFNGTTNPLIDGNDIVLSGFQPVPEPATLLGLAAGSLALFGCFRKYFGVVRATRKN